MLLRGDVFAAVCSPGRFLSGSSSYHRYQRRGFPVRRGGHVVTIGAGFGPDLSPRQAMAPHPGLLIT